MGQIAFLVITLIVMYVVLWLPQRRRQKEAAALLAALEEGDEVILNSGIHGFLTAIDGDVAWLEVAPNVDLKVSRSAIAARIDPLKPAAG
jgi:preprotein translocase subunit YajC